MKEEREKLRSELTQLLQSALDRVREKLTPETSDLVAEFIDNYEFGLAYDFIMGELDEKDVGDAEASLKAAALRMGRDWKPTHDLL